MGRRIWGLGIHVRDAERFTCHQLSTERSNDHHSHRNRTGYLLHSERNPVSPSCGHFCAVPHCTCLWISSLSFQPSSGSGHTLHGDRLSKGKSLFPPFASVSQRPPSPQVPNSAEAAKMGCESLISETCFVLKVAQMLL